LRLVALLFCGAALAGCGTGGGAKVRGASLVLDFTPNAIHAGIYSALARGLDRAEGVRLHVIVPSASTDSIKLLEAGRVDFAILDIHDLAIARERGTPIVGIMAIVERPLAAVIAAPPIQTPRALNGKTVGITGDPSDSAVLDSIVAGSGGDPHRLHTVTIGFNAVADLLAGRVAAATAFWNDEGVTLRRQRPGFHIFRVENYGAPPYPELVLCATAARVRRDPSLARSVVRSLVAGYRFTLAHPARSAADLEREVSGLDPELVGAELRGLLPAFRAADGQVGALEAATLRRWDAWEARFGIVRRPPDLAATFDPRFVNGSAAG
jgi:NitT/TauT family transport system substrate-binding protein/putative hydroxymethylpyrimidine transport system substrate-binding protein